MTSAAAVAGFATAAFSPFEADAAFTTSPCQGAAIAARGASFQAGAQQGFVSTFQSSDFCGPSAPAVTYDPAGSGAGRRAFGERSGSNTTGGRDAAISLAATDEPPTPTQTLQMEKGPVDANNADVTASDDGELHVVPVASGASVIAVNFPDGCTPPSAALFDAAVSSKRVKLTAQKLEAAFYADSTSDTWGELLGGALTGTPTDSTLTAANITDCNEVPVRRVVRFDDSGTTFAQKDWLHKVNSSRSPAWTTFSASPNTSWPNAANESSAAPCPATSNLCKNTSNGNGALLDRLTTTDGGIGYADIATSRSKGYEVSNTTDDTFWIPVIQSNGTAYEPTSDPNAYRTNGGVRGANCGNTTYGGAPSNTLGDWATTSGTLAPSGTGYPICTLTYVLAWDDYRKVYGSSSASEQKARTVKDYLTAIVSSTGQAGLAARDYSPIPTSLRSIAQAGVGSIGYDKGTGTPTTTTPTTTTPTTTTPTTTTPTTTTPTTTTPTTTPTTTTPTTTPTTTTSTTPTTTTPTTPTTTPVPSGGGTPTTPPPAQTTTPAPTPTPTPAPAATEPVTFDSARASGSTIKLALDVPAPGTVKVVATATVPGSSSARAAKTLTVRSLTRTVTSPRTLRLTLTPSKAAKAALRRRSLKVRMTVTFTPKSGGASKVTRRTVTLKKLKK